MLVANIEADELVMQAVTGVAKRSYYMKFQSGAVYPLGRKYVAGNRFSHTEVHKTMEKLGKSKEDYEIACNVTYGEESLAVYLMEKQIRKIFAILRCDRQDFWLGPSDGSNFRFKSAKTQPYKSNRGEKPELVIKLREYLKNRYQAQEIQGHEADDALGIYQKDNTIAVHCDKDIFMIPGKHFNTITDQIIDVSDPGSIELKKGAVKGTGIAFFWAQMLTGDPTDTIPSFPHKKYKGYGAATTFKALGACKTEEEMAEVVIDIYKDTLGDKYQERLEEQADLVYICREEGLTGKDYVRRWL